ncbi:MAG: acyltransferase family protein, partial [Chloroflexota bacterium]
MRDRIYWLDLLRVLAGFAAVWVHVSAVLVYPSVISRPWWIANFHVAFTHWCLPVFIMITGYLLLSKPVEDSDTPFTFYKRRFGRLLIPLAFWSVFYLIFRYYQQGPYTLTFAIERVVTGRPFYHLWYIYMLVGLYLVSPFISRFLATSSRRWLEWAIIISFGMGIFDHLVNGIFNVYNGSFLAMYPSYVGYYLAGYYLATREKPLLSLRVSVIGLIGSCFLIAVIDGLLLPTMGDRAWSTMFQNLNPLILSSAICMFTLVQNLYQKKGSERAIGQGIVSRLAPLTFGIYLVHAFFLESMLLTPIKALYETTIRGIPILGVSIYALSALTAFIISR